VFDPVVYFACVKQEIDHCSSYSTLVGDPVRIEEDPKGGRQWKIIIWTGRIEFVSGHCLEIAEIHRMQGRTHLRKVKYHLMDAAKVCVFRLDNHDQLIPFSHPCHIHVGEKKLEHDDPQLGGTSLCEIGFLEVFPWVLKIIEGNPPEWLK
jgi:Family of unknown function (DUF6516)